MLLYSQTAFQYPGAHVPLKHYNYTQKEVICFVLPGACAEQPHPHSAPPPPGSAVGSWVGWPLPATALEQANPLTDTNQGFAHLLHFMSFFRLPPLCLCPPRSPLVLPLLHLLWFPCFICCLLSRKQIAQPMPSLSPDWCFLLRPQVCLTPPTFTLTLQVRCLPPPGPAAACCGGRTSGVQALEVSGANTHVCRAPGIRGRSGCE